MVVGGRWLWRCRATSLNVLQGFNKEMDELYRTQKAYAVPDLDLRETLKRDNRDFVLPKYRTFLRKYVGVPFTKNLDKYHRYTEKDVIGFINKFFDSAV